MRRDTWMPLRLISSASSPSKRLRGWSLDGAFTVLAIWMTIGVAMDFRVHSEGISFAEEGFFTVSHLTFYSAFLAIALLLVAATVANRRTGQSWRTAVPEGYRLGVLGVFLFGLGGPADLVWHSTFGFEQGVEALTSPTHLLLAVGAILFLSSPLRAAWERPDSRLAGLRALPALVSASFVLNTVAFFSLYGNPLSLPMAAPESGVWPGHGVLSIAAFSVILVGLGLALITRFELPTGAFTLVFTPVGVLVAYVGGTLILAIPMAVAGISADGFYRAVGPSRDRTLALRLFAAGVPFTFASAYFLTTAVRWGIGWTIHVWVGAVAVATFAGLLLSYAVHPTSLHSSGRTTPTHPATDGTED